jgi:cytochrome c
MKKTFLMLTMIAAVIACNNSSTEPKPSTEKMDPEAEKGLELIAKNDCLTCHKVSETFQGPAYEDVAEKYRGNEKVIDTLVERVINGSQGVWGGIPMIAHPSLSKEDARAMVHYVLSLKKQ